MLSDARLTPRDKEQSSTRSCDSFILSTQAPLLSRVVFFVFLKYTRSDISGERIKRVKRFKRVKRVKRQCRVKAKTAVITLWWDV